MAFLCVRECGLATCVYFFFLFNLSWVTVSALGAAGVQAAEGMNHKLKFFFSFRNFDCEFVFSLCFIKRRFL